MLGEVLRVRGSITMRECGIDHRPISRLHCIVFPGKNAKVMDLFSTNGTAIARLGGGGGILEPGIRVDLYPGDILLLAKGLALFQYLAVAEEEGKPPDEENGVLPFGTVSPRYPRLLPRDH
ncbi:MAG: FHA domain-containing protein [Deltaproteobacteria bacterium]|nr:FHA domain-containing protein [Deltaproteobacteria bacterium]